MAGFAAPILRLHYPRQGFQGFGLRILRLRYPGRKLIAVFEPRTSSSKRKVFQDRYTEALKNADVTVIINPVPTGATEDSIDTLQIQEVLRSHDKGAYSVLSALEALNVVLENTNSNDVTVFMSSGDLDGIPLKFLM